jgi:hypothetical protein
MIELTTTATTTITTTITIIIKVIILSSNQIIIIKINKVIKLNCIEKYISII